MKARILLDARLLLAGALLLASPCALMAQPAGAPPANAQTCAACHGARGEGSAAAPRIAGQPPAYIERQLAAFADGHRDNPTMTPIAKGLSEDDRRRLAEFFAGQSVAGKAAAAQPAGGGRGAVLATRGDDSQRLPACQNCHGPGGRGMAPANPALRGLSKDYLTAQLRAWRDGSRRSDPSGQMNVIGKSLRDSDIAALAGYYAALAPVR